MKTIILSLALISTLFLASCGTSNQPLTEAQQAESYNMSLEEFREMKDAAARMNMSIEDHMKHADMWHGSNDSHMWHGSNDSQKMQNNPIIEEDGMEMGN